MNLKTKHRRSELNQNFLAGNPVGRSSGECNASGCVTTAPDAGHCTLRSGVAVLSPSESSGCSSSDITEPRSPRSPASPASPESGCSSAGDDSSCGARMPPWANEPAPPPRRIAAQPAPTRRPANPPLHRRITEFFNHKMKPQTGKREASTPANDDTKRKCLPKNGVTQDLEKYISYLSQTLSPMIDVGTQERKPVANGVTKATDLSKKTSSPTANGMIDCSMKKDNKEKPRMNMNGFIEMRNGSDPVTKEKTPNGILNGMKKHAPDLKMDPSANGIVKAKKQVTELSRRMSLSASNDVTAMRIAPATPINQSPKKTTIAKADTTKMNGVVSSTTAKLDSRMNGVTCGSNNISLSPIACKPTSKKEAPKKAQSQAAKRTNRKSSACIANSKNLTWSKANNLKQQVQLQKQNCVNAAQVHNGSPVKTVPEASTAPKMNIPNGVRQVSMTVNGSLNGLNVPVNNQQPYHQLNIPQPCNGTVVTSTHMPSFVAVPQNVMLTTLRIPQNGIQTQTINQQNNLNAFNRQNVNGVNMSNVSSPTKLNGQFVFPFVQNINGTVVQIPNLMAKMPNFVLPQNAQLAAQRQDHLQNQQAAQILINGTLLKLANTMNGYTNINNMNKPVAATSQPMVINKNIQGMPPVGMTMQSKPNYTVNYSHPVLVPQPGFIVTSVPNMNVKETWSYTGTSSASSTTCSTPLVQHPTPIVTNYSTQPLHTSSIPIAPAKPPDNPIQGTDPPSSTVKEPESCETSSPKFDMPWLSKTVNNNIVPLDSKIPTRAFAEVSSLSGKLDELKDKVADNKMSEEQEKETVEKRIETDESLRKIEEVARREETIFTQITVLKDVSSNVHNSVIEANYFSSQKSPILKQPKTLRFPPKNPSKAPSGKRTSSTDTTSTVVLCMWEECKSEFDSDADLLEHLQASHVESQAGKENFVCLWMGCKVRGKPSCSRLWLERHAMSHGGNKPFKCIVDNCDRRFSTQILLERHVNNHFTESSPSNNGNKRTSEGGSVKLLRRNGKKLRYRRQPWSARMFDFFDPGMMEGLAYRLARCTRWRLGGSCPLREPAGRHTITLHAALTATRYNAQEARREALLTYYPPHVLEDEWVPEKEVTHIKRVEISQLPAATKVRLYEQFTSSYRKTPSPPPVKKEVFTPPPARTLPARHCTSSRLLNNLLKKKESKPDCSATNVPMIVEDETDKIEVSGAKKRKMGRRHGGNAFWPCGR
ncbi:hypothetical protein NE865_05876 [Phthorimaea operculella]|nr:hypothetical protein NE865_05876 [Phthorimaea operculella]